MKNFWIIACLCLAFIIAGMACYKKRPISWIIYYGSHLTEENLKGVDLAVVEPDLVNPVQFKSFQGLWVAYLSLGEVHKSRPYWQKLKDEGALVEENPEWPLAFRVNPSHKLWKQIVLDEIIPDLVNKGYQGLFFDTIDVASYLESKNLPEYAGMKAQMVDLIAQIHDKYPNLLLFPNNGFDFLTQMAPHVDGVFVEDLYTRYDFSTKTVINTPEAVTKEKEDLLDLFRKRYSKNVFVIHYGNEVGDEISIKAFEKAQKKGYQSYLTTIKLDNFGKMPNQ